jgi:hypothetical protein
MHPVQVNSVKTEPSEAGIASFNDVLTASALSVRIFSHWPTKLCRHNEASPLFAQPSADDFFGAPYVLIARWSGIAVRKVQEIDTEVRRLT